MSSQIVSQVIDLENDVGVLYIYGQVKYMCSKRKHVLLQMLNIVQDNI